MFNMGIVWLISIRLYNIYCYRHEYGSISVGCFKSQSHYDYECVDSSNNNKGSAELGDMLWSQTGLMDRDTSSWTRTLLF